VLWGGPSQPQPGATQESLHDRRFTRSQISDGASNLKIHNHHGFFANITRASSIQIATRTYSSLHYRIELSHYRSANVKFHHLSRTSDGNNYLTFSTSKGDIQSSRRIVAKGIETRFLGAVSDRPCLKNSSSHDDYTYWSCPNQMLRTSILRILKHLNYNNQLAASSHRFSSHSLTSTRSRV
jgi:hypothetical protein